MRRKANELHRLVDNLSAYVLARWEMETSNDAILYAGVHGDETAGRELIESFLTYCDEFKIAPSGGIEITSCFYAFKKVLKRALEVDMNDPSNRKGDLPKALGLASRRDELKKIIDRVIFFAFEHARRDMGKSDRSFQECAELLVLVGEKTGKFKVSEDKVIKTYQRMLEEIRGD